MGLLGVLALWLARRRRSVAGLVFLLAITAGATEARAAATLVKVAVLDLKAAKGVTPETAELVTGRLVAAIGARPGLRVISGADLQAMTGFNKNQALMGCPESSASCLAEIGGALGVDLIVAGTLGRLGDTLLFNAQVMNIRKAFVAHRYAGRIPEGSEEAFLDAADEAARELFPDALPEPGAPTAGTFSLAGRAATTTAGSGFAAAVARYAPGRLVELSLGPLVTLGGLAGGTARAALVPLRPTERLSLYVAAEGTVLFAGTTLPGVGGAIGAGWELTPTVQLALEVPVVHYLDGPPEMKRDFVFAALGAAFRL